MPLAASASASAYYMLMTLPDWQYEFDIISDLCFRLFFVFLDKKP